MNLTNPKVLVFFLAFLPQFADPQQGAVAPQILLLGAFFIGVTLIVFGGIALVAGWLGERLARSPRMQQWLNRLAGVVLAALALKLVL
jgi:threonine/homoserine/homoserine lactone efflux protein